MAKNSGTVAEILERHKAIRKSFEESQKAFFEARDEYRNKEAEVSDFEQRFGRLIQLFKE